MVALVILSGDFTLGGLGNDTLRCRFYDKTDTTKYIGSLTGICKRCGKSVLFLENVAYCKSKTLKEFLAKMGDTIKVICFSLHTPDLSPEGAMGDAQKNTLKLPVPKSQ